MYYHSEGCKYPIINITPKGSLRKRGELMSLIANGTSKGSSAAHFLRLFITSRIASSIQAISVM